MTDASATQEQSGKRAPRDRSPSFPFIPLETAIERLEEFDRYFGRHPTPADKAGLAWKMKEKSSQAYQTLAAIKAFGLIRYKGSGQNREVEITEEGRTYLRAQQDTIKRDVLKRLALKPAQIAKFFPLWGVDRPRDPVAMDELVLKSAYTEGAAKTFLRVYDETVAFAGVDGSDKLPDTDGDGDQAVDGDDNGGREDIPPPPRNPPDPSANLKRYQVMEGERELLTGPLSRTSGFRLIVNGKIGLKEIERLIAKLKLEKEILADADEDDGGKEHG
jgi:hypothetical protein